MSPTHAFNSIFSESLICYRFLIDKIQCIHYAGTMAQLFDVGNEECSVILLWTYSAAAIALTAWSTFLLWVLS